jgi:CTP:phosphocholine cytidylyltransferase-like protein
MTDREKQKALSLYRLTQAEESLDEAFVCAVRHYLEKHIFIEEG